MALSGTIYYGKSFINRLEEKLDTYLKFNSILDTRMNGLEDTLKTVAEKIIFRDKVASLTQVCKTILSYGINSGTISRNWKYVNPNA